MYDYIIVGAGSAGCVLAARLSADSGVSVLLLEAGLADDADEIRAPAAVNRLFQTAYDWNYLTVPQHRAGGRTVYWPRGKVLGGSSSINAMIYIRGNRHDFQTWRDEHGCAGWGYEDLMPYFRRAEDNSRGVSPYHGTGGPLSVTDPRYKSRACEAFIAAAQEQGAKANDDFNGPRQDGVGWYQLTHRNGQRCSAATAYLHPAMSRPNLTVHTDALVTKVIIEGGHAIGVNYLHHGEPQTARANAEVILSGGAVNSPQLLMLSGVGPAEHLIEMGIDVHTDLRGVGGNLSDHPVLPVIWSTPKIRGLWEKASHTSLVRWQLTHRGPLTSNVAESGGFAHSEPGLPAPDLQLHVLPAPYQNQGLADPARRGAGPRRARPLRRRAPGLRPQQRGDPVPPGRHLHDGRRVPLEQRGRPRAEGPRRDRAAGGRRVGDAGRAAREHQRAHDRDRRAGRRPHRRPGPAGRHGPRRPGRRHGDRRQLSQQPATGADRASSRQPAEPAASSRQRLRRRRRSPPCR